MQPVELNGVSVLITRPTGQGKKLCSEIEGYGGDVVRLPLIEIEELSDVFENMLDTSDSYNCVIFISPNSVKFGLKYAQNWLDSSKQQVVAIGRATAAALNQQGINDVVIPLGTENSEELLESPTLANIERMRILIVRGEGGRELLADTLRQRGALVSYLEVYRRHYPTDDPHATLAKWWRAESSVCVLTSVGATEAFLNRCRAEDQQRVLCCPVVVLSPRMQEFCREIGWQATIKVCSPADDNRLLYCINGLVKTNA